MSNSSNQNQNSWRLLYRTAILQKDRPSSGQRILRAERAIVLRRRELDGQFGEQAQAEKGAMNDALDVLKALRSAQDLCWICGKPIAVGTVRRYGDRVHEDCCAPKLKLEQATDGRYRREDNQEKLATALQVLFDLLEEYTPVWYTQEHHDMACAVLASSRTH